MNINEVQINNKNTHISVSIKISIKYIDFLEKHNINKSLLFIEACKELMKENLEESQSI